MTDVAEIAAGLTTLQRQLLIESEPGAFGRDDDATGAELIGASRYAAARALERKGLGDIEESPGSYPSGLYFSNSDSLSVRSVLTRKDHA